MSIFRNKEGRFATQPKEIIVRDRVGKFRKLIIGLREESISYTHKSINKKTENIPQQWIGSDRIEGTGTCTICPLFQTRTCYSWFGTSYFGFASTRSAIKRGKDRTLKRALKLYNKKAKYFRFGTIGDPGSIARDVYEKHDSEVRKQGLGVLSYTHHWYLPHAKFLRGLAIASCDTWKDVTDAIKDSWRVAWHIDKDKKFFNGSSIIEKPKGIVNGLRYALCPAQYEEFLGKNNGVHCNSCGLCDAKKRHNIDIIIFAEHGQQMEFFKQREEKSKQKNQELLQLQVG
jgi:hypothetical protein